MKKERCSDINYEAQRNVMSVMSLIQIFLFRMPLMQSDQVPENSSLINSQFEIIPA